MKNLSILIIILAFGVSMFVGVSNAQETKAEGVQIVDAKLGKDVKERAIVDESTTFTVNSKVFLWLKVEGGSDQKIKVIWKFGEKTYETELSIGGSPWRTWATKTAYKAGDWSVSITDSEGKVLKELSFKVE